MSSIPVVVLPDPEDERCLQAWADVIVDEVPLRLLVDTGTPRSALPHVEPFATRPRRLTPGGRGAFGGPADEEMLVEADALRVGELVATKLEVQLQPEGWRHPGLLGMDVLGSHRCDFHFDAPRIDLDHNDVPATAWYPLTTASHSTPTVPVTWHRTSVNAVWDTGAGAEASHHWGTLAACRIGGAAFTEQTCAIVDLSGLNASLATPMDVVLGLPLIAQASWCMDYPHRRWTLWP